MHRLRTRKNLQITMRFVSSLLHIIYHILPSLICIICAVTSISPVLGEESIDCDANTSAGETTCAPKDDVDHDTKIINEGEKEEIERPKWWNYNSEEIDFF